MIARVYKLASGSVMSFDHDGDLIQRFSVPAENLHDEILAAAPPDAQFFTVEPDSPYLRLSISREEF